jgi:hypothetical protein
MKKIIGNKAGNVINLIIDGNAFQKTFETQDEANAFFKLMFKAREGDEKAYEDIMIELNRKYKTVIKGVLEKDSSDNYFLKGIDIIMPEFLAETFIDYLDNNFPVTALENFWKLLVTNPDPRVRNDLFLFLQTYNFAITDNGYFIAYKAVEVKKQAEEDIAAFVSNQYLKIKKWKKNVQNYEVVKFAKIEETEVPNPDYTERDRDDRDYDDNNDDYDERDFDNDEPEFITSKKTVYELKLVPAGVYNPEFGTVEKVYGNLADLFKNIDQLTDNRSVYQSKHSGKTGKIEQFLGVPVKMERVETNKDPKVECSSGLHVGSVKYVESFSTHDDTILLVLVNPAHVVAVPEYDNSKIRTCEYFPYAVLDRLENKQFEVIEEIPFFEEDYMKYEKADLEKEIARINGELDRVTNPEKTQLDYKKILEERLVVLEHAIQK